MRHKLQPWDMGKKDVAQTWALWAMDVAYDTANNAYVLDLNARPAPTGTHHPSWYRDSRALIAKFFLSSDMLVAKICVSNSSNFNAVDHASRPSESIAFCFWRHCFLCFCCSVCVIVVPR